MLALHLLACEPLGCERCLRGLEHRVLDLELESAWAHCLVPWAEWAANGGHDGGASGAGQHDDGGAAATSQVLKVEALGGQVAEIKHGLKALDAKLDALTKLLISRDS